VIERIQLQGLELVHMLVMLVLVERFMKLL